jgi:hypothetical protein
METTIKWDLCCHQEQPQEFVVNLWVVTTE